MAEISTLFLQVPGDLEQLLKLHGYTLMLRDEYLQRHQTSH